MRKFQANVQRDRKAISSLKSDGWQVGVIWECETKDPDKLEMKLIEMLKDNS
jgi:DNA mismatch endonuclease (patch repair protein)